MTNFACTGFPPAVVAERRGTTDGATGAATNDGPQAATPDAGAALGVVPPESLGRAVRHVLGECGANEGSRCGPIGVIDTGFGGVTHTAYLRELLPGCDLTMLQVNEFAAAGEQTPVAIRRAFVAGIAYLLEVMGCCRVHVACVSASSVLREADVTMKNTFGLIESIEELGLNFARANPGQGLHYLATEATVRSGVVSKAVKKKTQDAGVPIGAVEGYEVGSAIEQLAQLPLASSAIRIELNRILRHRKFSPGPLGLYCTHLEVLPLLHGDLIAKYGLQPLLPGKWLAEKTAEIFAIPSWAHAAQPVGRTRFLTTVPDPKAVEKMEVQYREVLDLINPAAV